MQHGEPCRVAVRGWAWPAVCPRQQDAIAGFALAAGGAWHCTPVRPGAGEANALTRQ